MALESTGMTGFRWNGTGIAQFLWNGTGICHIELKGMPRIHLIHSISYKKHIHDVYYIYIFMMFITFTYNLS